jgi:hypothetical protein
MKIQKSSFYQEGINQALQTKIESISTRLEQVLNRTDIYLKIIKNNQPGCSSQQIQDCFSSELLALGFTPEAKGLFKNAPNQLLRPDYYLPVEDSGIIFEVERGKVTINNMDILDFWKCHLCDHANFLFLMVPLELRQNESMKPRREFNTVQKRLSSFFEPDKYTNVWGLVLFGY